MAPYFASFLGLGVAISFFGPALPTLRHQTHSTLGQMGLVFAAQSLGGLVGSIAAGRLFRSFGGPHLIALAVFALAGSIALTGIATSLVVVVALGAVLGLGAGTMDVGANTLVPTVVDPDSLVSSMNALHMCFAIGAVATPLLVGLSTATVDGLELATTTFGVVLAALGFVLWTRDRAEGARRAAEQHEEAGPSPAPWRLAFVAAFFLLYVGLEVCFAGWIATYADELHLGAGWPTALTATFWGGFLVGRLGMAWRGDRLDTGRVLWVSVLAATVIAVAIAVVGSAPVAILALAGLFGAVIAPQFPTMLAHLHRAFPLTGPVTAWCIAGSAVGGLTLPPLIGALFDGVGAGALPWTVAAASAASALVLLVIDRYALVTGPFLRGRENRS
ncbi:MAG: MFS transporter [Acidimicrobiia bacterium]